MLKKTIFLVMLAALALPVLAAAQQLNVQGPVTIHGHGLLRGELQAPDPARSVRIRFRAGSLRIVDLAGDLKIRCKGRTKSRQNDQGQTVYLCGARAGGALVNGSHYDIGMAAMKYGLKIPEGVSGTLSGRFRSDAPPTDQTGDAGGSDASAEGR